VHESRIDAAQPKPELYVQLERELAALIQGERDFIANLANSAALLYHSLPDLNWVGYYLLKDEESKKAELVVGPFQGKPACVRIAIGKGVCGTAAQRRETVVVRNVHDFPGHIACDAASNSEIVVPMIRKGELLGVLDLDSPKLARFDDDDRRGLEQFVTTLLARS
jgi:GAF domain-containing protein